MSPAITRGPGPGPLAPRDPTLAKARREALEIERARVHLDVARTLRAVEHARARWRAGAEIDPENMEGIFGSVIATLDDVMGLIVHEMTADEAEGENPR